jgi:O-antigen ligase
MSKVLAVNGPFNHNNGLATYLACALIVLLYWIFSNSTKIIKSTALITFFSGIFILIYAYSRGGWIAFIFAIILLACCLKEFWFLGIALGVTLILGFKINLLKFLFFKDAGRFELWAMSLRMIKLHPVLGNGIGTFMARFRSFSPTGPISYAHNCYLQIWAEAGVISLALFLLFIFMLLIKGFLAYKKTKELVLAILVCAIAAYACHSFFDTTLFSSQLAFLFWSLMGLLQGSLSSKENIKPQVT